MKEDQVEDHQVDDEIRLQLNADKTEVMWCASARRQSQLPRSTVTLAGAVVHPVSSVRDLGVVAKLLGKPDDVVGRCE